MTGSAGQSCGKVVPLSVTIGSVERVFMALTLFRKKTPTTPEVLDVSRVLKTPASRSEMKDAENSDEVNVPDTENAQRAERAMAAAARVAEELSLKDDSLGTSLDPETMDEDTLRPRPTGPRQVPWQKRVEAALLEDGPAEPAVEKEIPAEPVAAAEPDDLLVVEHDTVPVMDAMEEPGAEKQVAEELAKELADVSAAAPIVAAPAAVSEPKPEKLPRVNAPLLERMTPFALWVSVSLFLSSIIYAVFVGGVSLGVVGLFAGGIFIFATILLIASLTGAYSPLLLAGLLLRRPTAPKAEAQSLAGRDVLAALGLAENLLDADVDARLVTSRDGVVVYANEQYMKIARLAGVVGVTGLPPRIDRLFSQSSGESSKMFRLARAARSGLEADEIITQTMGLQDDGSPQKRRYEISVRPMADKGKHVAWRLREMPVETAKDTFRKAYEAYPRPVLALERSGNIAWLNEAAKELLGVGTIRDVSFSDIILGESKDVVEGLWEDAPEEFEGRVRAKSSDTGNVSVIFTAFTRAGVGEGFVCVEMMPKTALTADKQGVDAAADLTDAPIGVAIVEGDVTSDARLGTVNRLIADSLGAKPGMRLADVLPPDSMRDLLAAMRAKSATKALTRPVDVLVGEGADGQHLRLLARPIKRRRGAYGPRQMVLYAIDVSFQKRMEEDYAHDKRLKAIGKIAGSVAHDFNNFLQAMMGATEFLMRRHPAGDPSYPDLVSIRENAQRARNLTSNLLAFSRKQTLQPEVVSVTELLSDFTPFVQRYVTEKVKVEVDHGRQVGCVKADRSQLELAIMNLAVNARDAMDKGGTLTVRSRRVPAAEIESYGYQVLENIDHVLIEMEDTGPGVPADIADKIFEPFFTTKGEGKGTGLGLSTVHGIVGQLGGRIFLHNRPGEGATFRIFMPALSEEEATAAKPKARKDDGAVQVDDLTGKGRILIVEDEDSVRNIVVRALGMCGYEIVEACDGDEALEIIEDTDEPFDVVLSDIMMPEMDGPTLIQEAGDKLGKAKVIFMSGYAETAMRDKLEEIQDAGYLQKPFTLKKVAAVVKEAMAE